MKTKSTFNHLLLLILWGVLKLNVLAQPVFLKTLSPNAGNYTSANGMLYFSALDSLIRSDGTSAGTLLVKATGEKIELISPLSLNNYFFFVTVEASGKRGLWKSNGTAAATSKIGSFAQVNPLIIYNGQLYLAINDGTHGSELWKLNSTLTAVSIVKDIAPGAANGLQGDVIISQNLLYFRATTGSGGINIWKSDGTEAGTVMAVDLPADNFNQLTDVNGTIFFERSFFTIHDSATVELWKTNGTQAGTALVKRFSIDYSSYYNRIAQMLSYKNKLYFVYEDFTEIYSQYLYVSDGTAAGTRQIALLNRDGFISEIKVINGMMVFWGDSQGLANWLWKSDGTAAGTQRFHEIRADLPDFEGAAGMLFFSDHVNATMGEADSPEDYFQLWQSNLTDPTTKPVRDIYGGDYSGTQSITSTGNAIFFVTQNNYPFGTTALQRQKRLWYFNPSKPTANVSYFTLVNADTDTDIQWLKNGDIIYKSPGQNINIRYNTVDPTNAVVFTLNGIIERIDFTSPYSLAGDNNGNYYAWQGADTGHYTLTANSYALKNLHILEGTPTTIHFTIRSTGTGAASAKTATVFNTSAGTFTSLSASPNPSADNFNISVSGTQTGFATVEIYRMDGSLVEKLYEGDVREGQSLQLAWKAEKYEAGMYICKYVSDREQQVTKMILNK